MADDPNASAFQTNAYAISYRLMGDRPAARSVAAIAAERLRAVGGMERADWMQLLVQYTLDQTVDPAAMVVLPPSDDPYTGLRAALRRRLERATPDERVAASLLHLCGYPLDWVASVVGQDAERTARLAGVLAPPPGVDYRDLGDPELIRHVQAATPVRRRRRRPHWTTVAAALLVVAVLLVATQLTGPRPTLGPPMEEGGLGLVLQRNGGPSTQQTRE